jgi:hypothetical protein
MHLAPYPDPANKTKYPWPYKKALAPEVGEYYLQNGLTMENYKTIVYSKLLHELSYDGTIYGFAYDDNNDQASYISGVATDVILTINNSRGSITPLLGLLLD